jgi:hypothetical protein
MEQWVAKASKWLETSEGQQALQESKKQSDEMIQSIRQARQISPERLREPITL